MFIYIILKDYNLSLDVAR